MCLSSIWLLANVCTLLQTYKASNCEFLYMLSCLTGVGFSPKVLPFGTKWTSGPHAPFQRDKHSHMLKNQPYSSTQPSTGSRQHQTHFISMLVSFFFHSPLFLYLILPKVFFLSSASSMLASPIKPLYHTAALTDPMHTVRAVQNARQSEPKSEFCVQLCSDRQKRLSKRDKERGVWRAEGAEIHDPEPWGTSARPLDVSTGKRPILARSDKFQKEKGKAWERHGGRRRI